MRFLLPLALLIYLLWGGFVPASALDTSIALPVLTQRAEQGERSAQFQLGARYSNGQGAPKDLTKARYWFEKAAQQGDPTSQFNFALMCAKGYGGPEDKIMAHEYYLKAAENGNRYAFLNLGIVYKEGLGVPRDQVKARYWFEKGAHLNDLKAQTYLITMLYYGNGGPKDLRKAYMWTVIAQNNGSTEAREVQKKLEAMMTPDQINAAKAALATWKPEKSKQASKP